MEKQKKNRRVDIYETEWIVSFWDQILSFQILFISLANEFLKQ